MQSMTFTFARIPVQHDAVSGRLKLSRIPDLGDHGHRDGSRGTLLLSALGILLLTVKRTREEGAE